VKDNQPISQSQMPTAKTLLSHSGGYQICLVDESHARLSDVEAFIAACFLSVHDAHVTSFIPISLVLFADDDAIRAAIGVRDANHSSLFLEHYFDQSIEAIIADRRHEDRIQINRESVIEVGNLASLDRFASRRLFESLVQVTSRMRHLWR
jgi:hypothetical protein